MLAATASNIRNDLNHKLPRKHGNCTLQASDVVGGQPGLRCGRLGPAAAGTGTHIAVPAPALGWWLERYSEHNCMQR